ncbi:MAG: hypothetical protein KGO05_12915 [Chloroflexota bacterium]|nr:hypothetical protein [Chloroflexota bacterium]
MDSAVTAKPRGRVRLIETLAILAIFLSGIIQGSVPQTISMIGAGIALIGWVYAVVIAVGARQMRWLALLVLALVITSAISAYSLTNEGAEGLLGVTQLGFLSLAFLTLGYVTLGGGEGGPLDRGVAAFYGGWGLLALVIGGTLVGGAIGTSTGAAAGYITALGFQLYTLSGVLGAFAWVIGLVAGWRTKAWGWFAIIVLLPAIGAFMFGLFGPTRQDVIMAQEQARQKKAVGLG